MVSPVTAGLTTDLIARGQGTTVATWADASPGGAGTAVADAGSTPAARIDAATPAGGPALRFTGSAYTAGNIHAFDSGGSAEMFAVVRDGASNSFRGFYQLGGGSRMNYNFYNYIYDGSFTAGSYTFEAPGLTDWHIYNVSHDGTTRTTRIDGVVVHTATVGYTPPSQTGYDTLTIGNTLWTGDLAEVVLYTRSLGDTERAQVYDYLRTSHFVPSAAPDPVTAGLIIDLRARGQADTLTSWTDSSPAGAGTAVFTTGSAPAVRVDNATPTGGPAVRFTDAGYRTGNAHAYDTATSGEMFAVVRDGGSNSFHGFYQLGGNSPVYYNWSNYIFDGSFTYSNFPFAASGLTDWHIYNVSHDGTTRTTRIDGVVVYTAAAAFVAPSASNYPDIMIGSPGWTGDVAEFAAYTRSLSDTERAQVYDYLRASHFVAAAAPAPAPVLMPAVPVTVAAGPVVSGAPAPAPVLMPAVPVTVGARPAAASAPADAVLLVPAVAVRVAAGAQAGSTVSVAVGPGDIGVDASTPSTITALAVPQTPIGVTVAAARPAFTVTTTLERAGLAVQVQYDTTAAFTAAVSVSTDAPAGLDAATVSVQAGAQLTDGTWFWRARITGALGAGPWSPTVSFAVDSAEGTAAVSGGRTVAAGTPAVAHLWLLEQDGDAAQPGGTAYLIGTGFGDSPVVLLGGVPVAVTDVTAVPDSGTADPRIDPVGPVDPWHQRVGVLIPDVDADTQGAALTVGAGPGVFLPLRPPPPLPDTGWSAKVYAHSALLDYARGRNPAPLAQIARFVGLSCSPELSDPGAGSVTLRLDDPVFSYALADGRTPDSLYRYENLWVLFEDGQWRGEFFGTRVSVARLPADESVRTVTIAGPGAGRALSFAQVLSPYYPKTPPKGKITVYQYKNLPVMGAWLQLLWAAQSRGVIPYVHVTFSQAKDSAGQPWEDTPGPKPKNSTTSTLGDVLFASGSSELSTAGKAAVAKLAAKISAVTYPLVTVTGYAVGGSATDNYQLALDRANTVRNAILVIRPLAQITALSRGGASVVASNATAAGQAKNRRVVVTYQSSPAYVDTVYTPQRGTGLLDLLAQLTSGQTTAVNRGPVHAEWIMRKGFQLEVRTVIGRDLSGTVVFHEGSSYLQSEAVQYDRSEVANVIAVQNQQDVYQVSEGPKSVAMWGRREKYVAIEGSYSAAVHAKIARTQRLASQEQTVSTTIKINPGGGRTPFLDFGVGDTIGLVKAQGRLPSAVDRQRVVAITATVDADNNTSYELTLQSTFLRRTTWLQTQVDSLINRKQGIRPFFGADEPTGGQPGDLWTPTGPAGTS